MSAVFGLMRALFDGMLYPFRGLSPLVGLTLVSVLFGIGMLVVLKYTSNQEKIEAVKRKIFASLFEIRLFNDDLLAILRAQWDVLRHNGSYLLLWLVPLLVMIPPLVLMAGQLHFHYAYQGAEVGKPLVLEVQVAGQRGSKPAATLEVPEGLEVEQGPMWASPLNELSWRIRPVEPGEYKVVVTLDGASFEKQISVGEGPILRRSPVRPSPSFVDQLLYPAEAPLPASAPITSIGLTYPPATGGIGWPSELAWMVVFLVVSMIAAFAFRKPFGVTF